MASKVGRVKSGLDGPGASCPTSHDAQETGAATALTPLPLAKGMIFPMSGDEHSTKTLGLGFFKVNGEKRMAETAAGKFISVDSMESLESELKYR